ncbi:MAG TPA: dienelactone hydrolase family protein [Pseudonocardiaceae bacterium]|nr:dienelactone hydrolase family protein [Pseudonocardiaceae bacterium]
MCHNHSTAPDPDSTIARHSRHTNAEVPYLSFDDGRDIEQPWLILATDIYGINDFYRHLAELLAQQGYRVAIPDLFHRVGPPRDDSREAALQRRRLLDDRQTLADFEAVIDEVTAGQPYGAIGFCLGGTLALLSAASRPEQTTLTWYAFPRGAPGAKVAVAAPIEVAHRIEGPVLAFWGREDYIDHHEVDELGAVLDKGGSPHEIVWYDHVGHAFLSGLTEPGPSSQAAQDSWRRGLSFLATHLVGG